MMKKESENERVNNSKHSFSIMDVWKNFKYEILTILVLFILNELNQVFNPYLFSMQYKSIEDYYNATGPLKETLLKNVYYINIRNTIIWSLMTLFGAWCRTRGGLLFTKIECFIKFNVFRLLHTISYEDFATMQGEDAFGCLKNIEYNIREIFSALIVHIFANLWTIIINIGVLFYIVPKVGFISLLWLGLHFLFLRFTVKITRKSGIELGEVKRKLNKNILESFLHILIIKTNNTKSYEEDILKDHIKEYKENSRTLNFFSEWSQAISYVIIEVILWGGGIYFLVKDLTSNSLPISKILFIVMTMYNLVAKVRNIGINITKLMENIQEYNLYKEILESYKIPDYENKQITIEKNSPLIELKNIDFLIKDKGVLKSVNLDIKQGERVCVIGSSGSGKSTLINLITGIYKKYNGEIFVYGQNIKKIKPEEVLNHFSIINQSPVLFNRSILDNLLGGQKIEEEKIIFYCKIAQIHEFITGLPDGYNTIIHSKNISGGQAQRLCLARMLLREKEVYIFDEATSGLDQETRTLLLSAIFDLLDRAREEKNRKTMIFIDHSLSFLHKVDRIIMLEKGEVVFHGTYEEIQKFSKFIGLRGSLI